MIRARINVKGRVQDVGYRTIVKQIARGFGIKGLVRNAENGSVEIFCETDRKTLEEFKKMIDIKSPPEDLFGVNAEKINAYSEGDKNYVNPPKKFEYFHIDYLDEELLKTSVERSEIGILVFKSMHKDLKSELKGFRNESKQSFDSLNKNLTGFRDETKTEFQTIKTDYGKISQDLGKAVESINTIAKSIEKLAEAIAKK
ncbi:MAG: acylphosphatase [Candidatus Thermoplasmatota archaeon]|nr:acylphosphatase [Candidatus Thermoplasmatota archaeon]